MSIKLIAIDLDGTLLNKQREITPEVKNAVLRAKKAGVHIVLASGRSFNGIYPYLKALTLIWQIVFASVIMVVKFIKQITEK